MSEDALVSATFSACELCGAADQELVLHSPRLDGPLVRCRRCGLVYVGRRLGDYTFAGRDDGRSQALAQRVAELGIVSHEVEAAELPLRLLADRERLVRLQSHAAAGGRLLDVGAATGTFLQVAEECFDAAGVEPDPITSEQARAAGHAVTTGSIADLDPDQTGFDAITMFHVIEHLDSPRAALVRAHELLRPGGIVMIETPTVDSVLFRVAPGRWRQLIPDHYYFFSRATLERLLSDCGFASIAHEKVGRRVSLRFAADRLRRSGIPGSDAAATALRRLHLERLTVRVNPGDIMNVTARRR